MTAARNGSHMCAQNLRIAPYAMTVGAVLAALPGFWVPLHVSYLALAVGVGTWAFGIQWLGVRHRRHFGPFVTIVAVIACNLGRDFVVGDEVSRPSQVWYALQFVGVMILSLAGLHLTFRKRLAKNLEIFAHPGLEGDHLGVRE